MRTFEYQRPATLPDVLAALAAPEARVLAGGMSLIPSMKLRLATPDALVDLHGVGGLDTIAVTADAVTIGAMTTHAAVADSAAVQVAIPALAALAGGIGDPQVRNRGTLGGAIANNDPAADYPAALVALGATVVTSNRTIPAEAFFLGMFETALAPGEIVTAVRFPLAHGAAYEKFRSPASRYALAGVFVAVTGDGVRVAVTGAGPCVFRLPDLEAMLAERFAPEALANARIPTDGLNADMHADAEYRAHLVCVLTRRAVARIVADGTPR
jgi:carbon-monoxide dehydrogenase medium subunit